MGLNNYETEKVTYVNISKGRFYTKLKDREPIYYTDLTAYIINVDFRYDEYNGKRFELAKFTLQENEQKYILQIRTDSGYFRALCNSLKTGNPQRKFTIHPSYKENNGKQQTTMFVKQDGEVLKHAHTLSNMGDLPQAKKIMYKGQEVWDSSEQITYWKKWLSETNWYKI